MSTNSKNKDIDIYFSTLKEHSLLKLLHKLSIPIGRWELSIPVKIWIPKGIWKEPTQIPPLPPPPPLRNPIHHQTYNKLDREG